MGLFSSFLKLHKSEKIGICIILISLLFYSISSCFASEPVSNYTFINRADMDQFQGFGYTVKNGQPQLSHNATLSTSVYYINDDDATYYIVIPRIYFNSNFALFVASTTEMPAVGVNCTIPTQILGNSTLAQSWSSTSIDGYYVFNYNKLNSIFTAGSYLCLTTRNSESTTFNKSIYVLKLKNMTINEVSASIVSALQNQTDEINNSISSSADKITNTLTDNTVNDDSVSFDTSSTDNVSYTEVNGVFTSIFNAFNSSFNDTTTNSIDIGLPFVDDKITIPVNLITSHLGVFSYLLNSFWLFVFGKYAFSFMRVLINSIKSGNILDGLSFNEVISSDMM